MERVEEVLSLKCKYCPIVIKSDSGFKRAALMINHLKESHRQEYKASLMFRKGRMKF